ncbi:uncharacterized protein LOC111778179 isoform X2 [Cucurbita pepo subsp. pepo]|uniref:uncharacterized protein LOC111778179 isoform X2 n=1 Tax=Cucurbita pepo subsp. pepo TaxID=3664 RepID=UPI000C9DA2AD|nr:uncharacterized protein LOC111778179 isoform X2 [Cucurbita pepo subsp. pepo]
MASATATVANIALEFRRPVFTKVPVNGRRRNALVCLNFGGVEFENVQDRLCTRSSVSYSPLVVGSRFLSRPTAIASSGLEAAITDYKGAITLKNAKIVVESEDESMIQLRVDLTGDETQKVFDQVLTNLARSAPPMPGFRKQKGGKTSNVPKSFLLEVLGKDRVTKFVIQEILNSTMADYAKKANIKVKDKMVNTTQTEDELKVLFRPGKEFGFNAILELEPEPEPEPELDSASEDEN